MFCSTAAGEKAPQSDIEKTMTTKAQLSKAPADSTAYCDKVIDAMNDTKGLEIVRLFGPTPRFTSSRSTSRTATSTTATSSPTCG